MNGFMTINMCICNQRISTYTSNYSKQILKTRENNQRKKVFKITNPTHPV